MKRQSSKQSGFTLVEIAIVLVIIGLLLGGVLKGQELITSSKGKALDNDVAGIKAAFTSYTDRYKALAGDDSQAAVRFTVDQCGGVACVPGNGNGLLAGVGAAGGTAGNAVWQWNFATAALPQPAAANENVLAWQHLRAAGFLKAGEANPTASLSIFSNPKHAAGSRIGVQAGQIFAGQQAGTNSQVFLGLENVPTSVAQSLDSSVDDGFVNLGTYRGAANPTNIIGGLSYAVGINVGTGAANPAGANAASFNVGTSLF